MKAINISANEAIANMAEILGRHYTKGPQARAELRKWLDALESPITYSNEDIDRASQFADFLAKLAD